MQSRHVVLMECMDESLINGKQSITKETKKTEIVSETLSTFLKFHLYFDSGTCSVPELTELLHSGCEAADKLLRSFETLARVTLNRQRSGFFNLPR